MAAAAALLLVACTLLVSWHRATTLHGTCAEHGDEIHLEQVDALRVAPPPADRDHDGGGAPVVTGTTFAPEDGDHHCQLAATQRDPDLGREVGSVTAPPLAAEPHALPDAIAPPATIALYRLAPKTSPPA